MNRTERVLKMEEERNIKIYGVDTKWQKRVYKKSDKQNTGF